MSTLEYFEVDSTEPVGAQLYRRIASTVITDHNLLKVLERLRIFIDPSVPVFVAVGITELCPGPLPYLILPESLLMNRK
jgi:hypothetical protein